MTVLQSEQKMRALFPALFFVSGAVAALALFYAGTFHELWMAWSLDEYSHGPLVALIAVVWGVRALQEKPRQLQPSWLGAALLVLGLSLHVVGTLIANNWLSQVSFILSFAGLLVGFLGLGALKRLAAPMVFLCFAVPLPATVMPALTAKMQLWSSDLGVFGLQLLGISVFQEGNIIDLGLYKLQVAEACSGLRYLFPLTSFGFLVAFHYFQTGWKRAALFLSTVPIGIFMNGLRLTATGIAANWFGIGAVQGTLHDIEGFIVFGFCLAALCLVGWVLERLTKTNERPETEELFCSFKKPAWQGSFFVRAPLGLFLFVLLSVSAAGSYALEQRLESASSSRLSFSGFPAQVGPWAGRRMALSGEELRSLKLTDYLLLDFRREGTAVPVTFYVAYYGAQRQGVSIHSPEICLPGSGWVLHARKRIPILPSAAAKETITVTRELIQKDETKILVYYWIREGSQDVTTNRQAKVALMKNALSEGRTDGALIRLTAPVLGGEGEARAEQAIQDLLKDVFPLLPVYLEGTR